MIKAIAIDDEPLALQVLQEHAAKINFLSIEQSFTNPLEAIEYLRHCQVDVVFLDINMQDISGMELAEMLPAGIKIIFITAYENYAVKGFELNAIDYLLKPVSFSRFLKACHKVKDQEKIFDEKIIMIKDGSEIIRVKINDIHFIEATGNYLKIHCTNGNYLHRQTVKEMEELLPKGTFIRCHKSYMVNIRHISRIELFQLTVDNQKIPVSPNYKDELWNKLGIKK